MRSTATRRLGFKFAALPESILRAHDDGELRDGDLAIVGKLLLRVRGWLIHAHDDELARLAGVAESTLKACLARLRAAGFVRSVKATVRGYRRAIALLWLAPTEAERQPLLAADRGAEDVAPEGPRAWPQEPPPPDPPSRNEPQTGGPDGCAAPPPGGPISAPREGAEGTPDPEALREVVGRVAKVSPPDPRLAARLAGVARRWGLPWVAAAVSRLEAKAQAEPVGNPVGYIVGALKGFRADGGPPLPPESPEERRARAEVEYEAMLERARANLFGPDPEPSS